MQDAMSLPLACYVAFVDVVAAIVWLVAIPGNPSPPVQRPKPTRHDDFIEPRDHVRRQIEMLKAPSAAVITLHYLGKPLNSFRPPLKELRMS
jgi:hypothetical protein